MDVPREFSGTEVTGNRIAPNLAETLLADPDYHGDQRPTTTCSPFNPAISVATVFTASSKP
jgi:hypothetical protein